MSRLTGPRLLLLIIAIAVALRLYDLVTSQPANLPWTPLSLSDPIGPFTDRKLGELRDDPLQCYALLQAVDVRYTVLPTVKSPGTCGYKDGVRLQDSTIAYNPPMAAACPVAAALFTGCIRWSSQLLIGILVGPLPRSTRSAPTPAARSATQKAGR